jgi:mono/diheme cytochrome c family protein
MRRGGSLLFLACVLLVALVSCAEENAPSWFGVTAPPSSRTIASDASAVPAPGPRTCNQALAQAYPQRLVTMSASASSGLNTILVSDLFNQFQSVCGGCHGVAASAGMGGFQILQESTFSQLMTASVIDHVTHAVCPQAENPNNPDDPMPPCDSPTGKTWTDRSTTNDSVYLFAQAVTEWLAAGSPPSFTPGAETVEAGAPAPASQFVMTPQRADAMTDIGNCIPGNGLLWLQNEKAAAMDELFAAATVQQNGTVPQQLGLPARLSDTDLFTFDSATLAQTGVIAYAPGYPLWTDNAATSLTGKLRYVRVPMGQSIHYNKATQQFEIPPNTRFYKTFMKQVVDTDGSYRYRKIETRMIVSRPDLNNPDGTAAAQTALFGTYKWRDDESEADLIETPLISGQPFSDTLLLINTNEPLADDVLEGQPAEPDLALVQAGAARHYAIPSSARCVQCHMGSASESFILGFTPLQINRFPTGTHGVIEAAGPDELTQLQRFIDAGIVTGIDSSDDVLPLEQSQGSRTPRNDYELTAQGYTLGNCSHCHNPRGYPSVTNPVLTCVLDFLPSSFGGLFQFPLENYSPRIGRGASGSTPIPYITPSLVDLPRYDPTTGQQMSDVFVKGNSGVGLSSVIFAPWRSIIYRNVDAAFAYVDDLALYPHMPMNSPGYDPRAKDILSDWMVSIPAVRKRPDLVEYAYQVDGSSSDNVPDGAQVDTSPQPYVEVRPGDPAYEAASLEATERLSILHTGFDLAGNSPVPLLNDATSYIRYTDPGETGDILDPEVLENPLCTPVPQASLTSPYPFPQHPHWVNTDLSNPPGAWTPRQTNWPDVLVHDNVPPMGTGCTAPAALTRAYADQLIAVGFLPGVTLSQISDYATTERPFGLWQQESGCDFSSQSTVASFTGAQRPHWMDVTKPPSDAPVYSQTPGEAVFKMICINCHGPRADATGRLAQNLATMTGGTARVADFRDGLFGPVGSSLAQSNRAAQFGTSQLPADTASNPAWAADWIGTTSDPITPDDRASRYMAWMGLGGTSVNIPVEILQIVAVTKVLDQVRTLSSQSLSANMLSQAKALCLSLVGPGPAEWAVTGGTSGFLPEPLGAGYLDSARTGHLNEELLPQNGDLELWLSLCTRNNPAQIHILQPNGPGALVVQPLVVSGGQTLDIEQVEATHTLLTADSYPSGTAVGNERGTVDASLCVDAATCCPDNPSSCTLCSLVGQTGCVTANLWPWCVDTSGATAADVAMVNTNGWPVCPPSVLALAAACPTGDSCVSTATANSWAVRGAINAGLSVFTYVESIENTTPPPDYDECNELPGSAASASTNACLSSP